jgi:predicted alpha/beta-hydrolase family hydrolase
MNNPLLVAFTEGLAEAGYPTLRFNFPYKEKGLKSPDRQEKLENTWVAVRRFFQEDSGMTISRIIAAGKSMGGRIASQMTAKGTLAVDGLIFLGYPLHPADDKEKLRADHLYQISVPMLFFVGTRDPLCDFSLLQLVLDRLKAPWEREVVEGGDHSFHVPKKAGLSEAEVFARIVASSIRWIEKTFPKT